MFCGCVCRVDFFIPGVEKVGGFSMCSSPGLLQREGVIELAVKYTKHPPAHWIHTMVSGVVTLCAIYSCYYYKYLIIMLEILSVTVSGHLPRKIIESYLER